MPLQDSSLCCQECAPPAQCCCGSPSAAPVSFLWAPMFSCPQKSKHLPLFALKLWLGRRAGLAVTGARVGGGRGEGAFPCPCRELADLGPVGTGASGRGSRRPQSCWFVLWCFSCPTGALPPKELSVLAGLSQNAVTVPLCCPPPEAQLCRGVPCPRASFGSASFSARNPAPGVSGTLPCSPCSARWQA